MAGKIALCSFFGSFTLSAAETWAFSLAPIPVVSFLTYSSGIVTVLLGIIFLKESITAAKLASVFLVGFGVYHLFGGLGAVRNHYWGALLSIVGGLGYSFFLLSWRGYKIPGGLASLWYMLCFGALFLSIPVLIEGPALPPVGSWYALILLTFLPTLGGFYLSSQALNYTEAGRVQLIETSEPVFASAFAFFCYGEMLTIRGFVGSVSVLLGIVILVLWRSPPLFQSKDSP
jgi:drug/metabolite transporter, DME family